MDLVCDESADPFASPASGHQDNCERAQVVQRFDQVEMSGIDLRPYLPYPPAAGLKAEPYALTTSRLHADGVAAVKKGGTACSLRNERCWHGYCLRSWPRKPR